MSDGGNFKSNTLQISKICAKRLNIYKLLIENNEYLDIQKEVILNARFIYTKITSFSFCAR